MEPSPFLRLPRQVRDKVYAYLFESSTKRRLRIVNPVEQFRLLDQKGFLGLQEGLSLFRTCRLIQSEVAASLYGNNVLVFDDKEFIKAARSYDVPTSYCGVTLMYTFLRLIGTLNRKSIRFLQIQLKSEHFFYHKDEISTWNLLPSQGRYLADAFDLLAQGHSLQGLEIWLDEWSNRTSAALSQFLRPLNESRLLRKMIELGGVTNFKISGRAGHVVRVPQELQPLYKELTTHLTTPKPVPSTTPADFTQCSSAKTEGGSMIDHARTAAARHTVLQKHTEGAETAIARWEFLIQQKKDSIRPFKAEMKEIDDRFTELKGIVDQFPSGESSRKRTAEEAAL